MELSTCCGAEKYYNSESDICPSCKEHADFVDEDEIEEVEAALKCTIKIMDEGYAAFLPGGVIVDIRTHPEARPAPGRDGRNARGLHNESE